MMTSRPPEDDTGSHDIWPQAYRIDMLSRGRGSLAAAE